MIQIVAFLGGRLSPHETRQLLEELRTSQLDTIRAVESLRALARRELNISMISGMEDIAHWERLWDRREDRRRGVRP